jgi:hypothetical protein
MSERNRGWVQTGINLFGVVAALAGWIFLGGASSQKLEEHARRLENLERVQSIDHDLVVGMGENLKYIRAWVDRQEHK